MNPAVQHPTHHQDFEPTPDGLAEAVLASRASGHFGPPSLGHISEAGLRQFIQLTAPPALHQVQPLSVVDAEPPAQALVGFYDVDPQLPTVQRDLSHDTSSR